MEKTLLILLTIVLIFIVGCANQQTILSTNPLSKVDPEVTKELREEEWIGVNVVLKDFSNIDISSGETRKEKKELLLEKYRQNIVVQEEIISTLSESEFKIKSTSPAGRGFSGEISKIGLAKLKRDSRVVGIRKPRVGGLA